MTPALAQKLQDVIGMWGRPPDEPAKVAAALALAALLLAATGRGRSLLGLGPTPMPPKIFLWVAAFSAALLSIIYIALYLRGGPRIIDATTYFLQGRALSHGDLAWNVAEPSASFRGRFLLYREIPGGEGVMGGIFPPGYPILLSLGFGIGAPMVVGPAIAAAIVIATYRLARTIAEETLAPQALRASPAARDRVEAVARTAALLSVVCGALRYHTADTMAHGASALGIALALDAGIKGRAVVAGLLVGAVVATRPVSAMAIGIVVLALIVSRARARGRSGTGTGTGTGTGESWRRDVLAFGLGMGPGVLLLLGAQHAVTGAWFASTQRVYYATSDGPPGCFRWGFGAGTGCVHEHGEFVAARLANGYGIVAAAGTTLRRLRMHLLDVANFEPLALLVLVPLARVRGAAKRSPATVAALAVVGLHILAYAPFYFDGNYPGGGARLLADVLPVEHALIGLAIARLATAPRYSRAAFTMLGAALAGFAVHASFDHLKLADRDGGRPMYEPDLVARSNVTTGLLFVDTDHAFALAYDHAARVKNGLVVARLRNDDRDRILYDRLDHPPTYLYKFEIPPAVAGAPPAQATPVVVPWAPPALGDLLRFEPEAEWPVLTQTGGFAIPAYATDACASGGRGLVLTPSPPSGRASATIAIPVPQSGRYSIGIRIVQGTKIPFVTTRGIAVPNGRARIGAETWDWPDVEGGACADLPVREVVLTAPSATLAMEAEGGAVTLDRITMQRVP